MARLPSYERQAVLQHCVDRFKERFDELAYALCVEAGKPIKDSEGEVTRLIDTFRIAAEESVRMTGEVQPLDISAARQGLSGHLEARADRAVQLHLAVQLPAQPRRAQDRAGARGRLPVRDEAGEPHAARARSSWARCWPRPICPRAPSRSFPRTARAPTCSPTTSG